MFNLPGRHDYVLHDGERIVVTDGPLKGSEGTLVEERRPRVILHMALPQRTVVIEMDLEWIAPASSARSATSS